MDLITSDPTPIPSSAPPPHSPSSASPATLPPPSSGIGKPVITDRKSKRGTLSQIQSDTISAAKAALNPVRINILPQKQKQTKKPDMILIEKDSWLYGEDGCLILRTLEWKRNGHMYNMPKMILLATNITSAEFDNAKAAGFLLWRVQVASPLSVVHYRNLDILLR